MSDLGLHNGAADRTSQTHSFFLTLLHNKSMLTSEKLPSIQFIDSSHLPKHV